MCGADHALRLFNQRKTEIGFFQKPGVTSMQGPAHQGRRLYCALQQKTFEEQSFQTSF